MKNFDIKLQHLSAGIVNEPFLTDNLDGTITIGDNGLYRLYNNPDFNGDINLYSVNGGLFTISELELNYIIINYNSGTPVMQNITDIEIITESDVIPIFTVVRTSLTDTSILKWNGMGKGLSNKIHQRLVKTDKFHKEDGGLFLNEKATRNITVTPGKVWHGSKKETLDAVDTSLIDNNIRLLYKNATGWHYDNTLNQYPNSYYNDTSTGLVNLSNNNYAVVYVFRDIDKTNKRVCLVLSNQEYNKVSEAMLAQLSDIEICPIIKNIGIFIGTIVIKKDANTAYVINQAQNDIVVSTAVPAHSDLSNLDYLISGHTGFQRKSYTTSVDPGVNNDEVDTAELGRSFVIGDFWLNTSNNTTFICLSNTAGTAIWNRLIKSGNNISLLNNDSNFISDLTSFTTSDLAEGANLYYTELRVSANTNVSTNTVHSTSDGSDHTYINQSVVSGSSPIFSNANMTGNISVWNNDVGYITEILNESIGNLSDVDLTGIVDGYILEYNATSGNFEVVENSNESEYWQRNGTVLSPLTAGDDIETSGNIKSNSLHIDTINQSYYLGEVITTTAYRSYSIGYGALNNNIGNYSFAGGFLAGADNIGEKIIALGYNAGRFNTTDYCMFFGENAGYANEGSGSIAFGRNSLAYCDAAGYGNIMFGYYSGYAKAGCASLGLGMRCFESSICSNSIGIGRESFYYAIADYSVGIGSYTGKNSTANYAIYIGSGTGQDNTENFLFDLGNQGGTLLQGYTNTGQLIGFGDWETLGNIETTTAGNGLIVTSPDGLITKRIGIDNSGNIVTTAI